MHKIHSKVSIHAPHEGERPNRSPVLPIAQQFQSTLPTRGSDVKPVIAALSPALISIHAPHEGERRSTDILTGIFQQFQSTLPTRGSDTQGRGNCGLHGNFNPRSPRGGATRVRRTPLPRRSFQSTLPTRGSDFRAGGGLHCRPLFQSTLPTRGSDKRRRRIPVILRYFNPRSPRGGATLGDAYVWGAQGISIHAPHEGERQRKSAFVCSISANLLNIIHCGTVTRCIAPQDCIIQAFYGAKKRCFYVRLCFALKNKGVRG